MADDIRAMDQLVFQMTQCTSWNQMQPHFIKLAAMCARRQKVESKRINEILRKELISVYTRPALEDKR